MQFQELSAHKDAFYFVWNVIKVNDYSCKSRFCLSAFEYTSSCN